MKRIFQLLIFLLLTNTGITQKVTGVYKGYMEIDSPKNTINFELTLKEKKGKLYGYCYRLFVLRDTLYYNLLKVNARISDNVLIVEDDYSVSNNFENNTRGIKTVFFFDLKDIQDTSSVLPGKWNTSTWRNYKSLTGVVNVIREKDYLNTQLYKRLADKKLDGDMAFEENETRDKDVAVQNQKNKPEKQNKTKAESDKEKTTASRESSDKNKTENKTADNVDNKEKKDNRTEKKGEGAAANNAGQKVTSNPVSDEKEKKVVMIQSDDKRPIDHKTESSLTKTSNPDTTTSPQLTIIKNQDTARRDYGRIQKTVSDPKIDNKILQRAADVVQTLSVFEDSVTFILYDNGEIDGDTVSVYVDNKLVLSKIGLSAKAQKITIGVPVGQIVQVSLFAETLGTIPPNTGLMLVNSGDQRYQVFFTSTLEKSASILFRRL
jgi:hypothetical protein